MKLAWWLGRGVYLHFHLCLSGISYGGQALQSTLHTKQEGIARHCCSYLAIKVVTIVRQQQQQKQTAAAATK